MSSPIIGPPSQVSLDTEAHDGLAQLVERVQVARKALVLKVSGGAVLCFMAYPYGVYGERNQQPWRVQVSPAGRSHRLRTWHKDRSSGSDRGRTYGPWYQLQRADAR